MQNNDEKQLMMELKDVILGKYFSYALKLYSQLRDKNSIKNLMLKKHIYELFFEETKKFINDKLKKHLNTYIKKKNFRLFSLELKTLEKNLKFLKKVIYQLDPIEKISRNLRTIFPWKKIHEEFEQYESTVRKYIKFYWELYTNLIEKTKQKLEKKQKRRREKDIKNGNEEFNGKTQKVELLLEMYREDNNENYIEYLPFLGVTSVRLRVLVNEPIKKLIIRPKFISNAYTENVEWSNYFCGINDENIECDLLKGIVAIYGGGHREGFVIYNPPAESYVFFFLRHHDKQIKEQIDYSITFEAIEEISDNEEALLSSITIQLKYPETIRPTYEIELPDYNGPYCPVHAIYSYDNNGKSLHKKEYREITFRGNQIPEYYSRWWPCKKLKYFPVNNSEKISNLIVRSYPDGITRIFYKIEGINGNLHQIGELKGHLTSDVFNDPMLMTTIEMFRFFSNDFIVLRIWFWWLDQRINNKKFRIRHEIPDCERVDFLIDLRNPTKDRQMIPFIATDVHWKEFWLDTRNINGIIKVKFTSSGIDLMNWQQIVAFFVKHERIMYNPLPAIIFELFSSIGDEKNFYCINCGERTNLPENVPLMRELIEDLSEDACRKRNRKIIEEMSDIICPACKGLFVKEEKLQYMSLFGDYSKFKKHLKMDILHHAMAINFDRNIVEGGTQPLSLKRQNFHVPIPLDGTTLNDWCSSTVIKPLSLERITFVKQTKENTKKIDVIQVKDLEGLNQKVAIRFAKIGIVKLKDLISAKIDHILSKIDFTSFTEEEIENFRHNLPRWQQMAELYQINGIGSHYSNLLVEIGANLRALKKTFSDPLEIIDKFETYNIINNDVRRIPSINEVKSWIEQSVAL